jgi:hypothetical protein
LRILEINFTQYGIFQMAVYTVFHEHPDHGKGRYITQCITAREAVLEAKEKVSDEYAKNPDDTRELAAIAAKLTIKVFAGRHSAMPATRADASAAPKA